MAAVKRSVAKTTLSAKHSEAQASVPRVTASSKTTAPSVLPRLQTLLGSHAVHIMVLIIFVVLSSLFFYQKGQQSVASNTVPSGNLLTTADVVQRVSHHILLPSGEQPTVATVTDASKVRNQAFFAEAATGDKVLIYAQAKKAYLYRPSIDRVIEVAPLAPNSATQPIQPAGQ